MSSSDTSGSRKRPVVAVVGGDGTGPEVVAEAVKVLEATDRQFGLNLVFEHHELGGDAYVRTGVALPDATLARFREVDAILFGAVGHPDVAPGVLEQGILLRLRRELDQYVNLRPVKLYPGVATRVAVAPEDVDLVVVRENTEGLYVGAGRTDAVGTDDETAVQESFNSRRAVERCLRYGFDLARRRRRHVTMCAKTNVLNHASTLWQRAFADVAADYPDIKAEYAHIDAACYWMIEDPSRFDVVVTDNMFGDIITDLGAAVQGGLGIAAGGNVNPAGVSMFEPIGGTAPGFEGTGKINPLAAIGAAAMLLDELGFGDAARAVESAVATVAGDLPSLRAGEMGATTTEVGDHVAHLVTSVAVGDPVPTGGRR